MTEQQQPSADQRVASLKERGLWCSKHNVERNVASYCSRCNGDGEIEDLDDVICNGMETCYACGGSGEGWPDCEFCLDEDNDYV